MAGKIQRVLDKVMGWRAPLRWLGFGAMLAAPFFTWQTTSGTGYTANPYWVWALPQGGPMTGFETAGGILFIGATLLLLGVRFALRRRAPRMQEWATLGLAVVAWMLATNGVDGDYTTGTGIEMRVYEGEGTGIAAWGAALVILASILGLRAARAARAAARKHEPQRATTNL